MTTKHFALRIQDEKTFIKLDKSARDKRLSVNSLINNLIDDHLKKVEKKLVKN